MLSLNLTYINNDINRIAWKINIESFKNFYIDLADYEIKNKYNGNMIVIQGENSYPWKIIDFKDNFPKISEDNIKIVEKAGKNKI